MLGEHDKGVSSINLASHVLIQFANTIAVKPLLDLLLCCFHFFLIFFNQTIVEPCQLYDHPCQSPFENAAQIRPVLYVMLEVPTQERSPLINQFICQPEYNRQLKHKMMISSLVTGKEMLSELLFCLKILMTQSLKTLTWQMHLENRKWIIICLLLFLIPGLERA